MESFNKLLVYILVFGATSITNLQAQTVENEVDKGDWSVFGESFDATTPSESTAVLKSFESLQPGETTEMNFKAKVKSVCQMKGCWMVLELDNNEEARVTFKDYAFFVPVDLAGSEVVVSGIASSGEIGVEELRHYAKDAGSSEEEIKQITKPQKTYSLLASGVMLKEE